VIELVGKYRVVAPGKRGHDADVRHVAGRKQQRARQPHEPRERLFQRVMRGSVTEYQVRCARADAVTLGAFAHGGGETRVCGESQVIIAAEGDDLAAVDHRARALRAIERAACALEPARLEPGKLGGEICEGHRLSPAPRLHRAHAEAREQLAVARSFRVAGGQ